MLSRREVVWLIGLMIAAVMMVGCVPNGFFEQTATVTLTETLTPAITETLQPSQTPTKTEIPSPTPERYPFDMAKLHNFPESYEKLVSNPEKFLESPDPFMDLKAFNEWWTELTDLMGDQTKLEPNISIEAVAWGFSTLDIISYPHKKPLLHPPEFFFFKHGGKIYQVPIFSFVDGEGVRYPLTYAVILMDFGGSINQNLVLKDLYDGKTINEIMCVGSENDYFSSEINQLVAAGISANKFDESRINIAVGRIITDP